MTVEGLKQKFVQIKAAVDFYYSLAKQPIRNNTELESTVLKMKYAKREILELLSEARNLLRKIEETSVF